ncbi:MAG: extracellular solute-binding protein [Eubacteriales bacterium]|nr:extracellular solute-binding protein [Eubacteriales bacterium]
MKGKKIIAFSTVLALALSSAALCGCKSNSGNGKTVVKMLQYKPEAVKAFEEMEKRFNETHDDIELKIESPNEAMTVLKTRLIKEDYPDIVGIGGDINYSNFLDADLFMDISDFDGITDIKPSYLQIEKDLEFIPKDGVYALPYVANAAGILYNRELFQKNGWEIPTTWSEFQTLCQTISDTSDVYPIYLGYKDTWTTLAPWNALAVGLADSDICSQVNAGKTTFAEGYAEVAQKIKTLLDYAEPNPYAYSYNDACTAFARGESAMYPIGSYAVPQILSVNPDLDVDSFPFPANENEADNVLNSGVDLQFSVMKECKNKEAAYEVLRFMYEDETIQIYLDDQSAVPCKKGDFTLPSMLDGMKTYIAEDRMSDFHDHHYPSEMSVDSLIQTYLMDSSENSADTFLEKFDSEWIRYNRDLIEKVRKYEEGQRNE